MQSRAERSRTRWPPPLGLGMAALGQAWEAEGRAGVGRCRLHMRREGGRKKEEGGAAFAGRRCRLTFDSPAPHRTGAGGILNPRL